MPSDSSYSHQRRLVTPSHALPLLALDFHSSSSTSATAAPHSAFTLDPSSSYAPSVSHSNRLTALLLSSSLRTCHPQPLPLSINDFHGGQGAGAEVGQAYYRFPETYNDVEYTRRMRGLRMQSIQGGEDPSTDLHTGDGRWGGEQPWTWSQEEVLLQPHLVSQLSQSEDLLPSEIHPAYPLGRPFPPRPSTLHPRASLPKRGTIGGTGSVSRQLMTEAALWNGLIEGHNFGEAGGGGAASAGAGSAGPPGANIDNTTAACPGGGSDAALNQPLLRLPAYLQSRSAIPSSSSTPSTASSSSSWPFTRPGPGKSSWDSILNPKFDHLSRVTRSGEEEQDWLEADLQNLFPRGRERDPLLYASGGQKGRGEYRRPGELARAKAKRAKAEAGSVLPIILSSSLTCLSADALQASTMSATDRLSSSAEVARIESHLDLLEEKLKGALQAQQTKGTSLAEEGLPEDQRNPEFEASRILRRIMSDAAGASGGEPSQGGTGGGGGGGGELQPGKISSSSSSIHGFVDRFGYPCEELESLALCNGSVTSPDPTSTSTFTNPHGDEEGEEDRQELYNDDMYEEDDDELQSQSTLESDADSTSTELADEEEDGIGTQQLHHLERQDQRQSQGHGHGHGHGQSRRRRRRRRRRRSHTATVVTVVPTVTVTATDTTNSTWSRKRAELIGLQRVQHT